MIKVDSCNTFIESRGDGISKSSVGNTTKTLGDKSGEPRLKNYPHVEWTLIWTEEEGDPLLILAKSEGEGKLKMGKTFIYSYVKNIEYDDNDSSNIWFDVDSSMGAHRVKIDEFQCNFIIDSYHPKDLKKDVQTKNNLIVALRPYSKRELMGTQANTPPKSSKKSKPKHKKHKKRKQLEEERSLDL